MHSHQKTKGWRKNPFPYYDVLNIVISKEGVASYSIRTLLMLAHESQQESHAPDGRDDMLMRDIGIDIEKVSDEEEDIPETPMHSCASRRVPRTVVPRPKKNRAIIDSIDNIAVVIEAISTIPDLTPRARMDIATDITDHANKTTIFLNISEEARIEYIVDMYGVHHSSASP
ncbi:hypothetical protein AMTR_s00017p00126470 [Amborella trichopoda]|uniref:Uncharacterized protein n=1 Tax=Amborella trichopoda TaxID=13333 RepID=W1PLL4_AMBTC|nr:hypothetical protein AMTR_s00017p00126470 [Amborella trichopoda]